MQACVSINKSRRIGIPKKKSIITISLGFNYVDIEQVEEQETLNNGMSSVNDKKSWIQRFSALLHTMTNYRAKHTTEEI